MAVDWDSEDDEGAARFEVDGEEAAVWAKGKEGGAVMKKNAEGGMKRRKNKNKKYIFSFPERPLCVVITIKKIKK